MTRILQANDFQMSFYTPQIKNQIKKRYLRLTEPREQQLSICALMSLRWDIRLEGVFGKAAYEKMQQQLPCSGLQEPPELNLILIIT